MCLVVSWLLALVGTTWLSPTCLPHTHASHMHFPFTFWPRHIFRLAQTCSRGGHRSPSEPVEIGKHFFQSVFAFCLLTCLPVQETQVRSLGGKDSPGERNGNPLQYSCLENPMDRGTWQATGHAGSQSVGHVLATTQQQMLTCCLPKKVMWSSPDPE